MLDGRGKNGTLYSRILKNWKSIYLRIFEESLLYIIDLFAKIWSNEKSTNFLS